MMLFSPVLYPPEQLPGWLAMLHRGLPLQYTADLSRGTLTDLDVDLGLSFAVVGHGVRWGSSSPTRWSGGGASII